MVYSSKTKTTDCVVLEDDESLIPMLNSESSDHYGVLSVASKIVGFKRCPVGEVGKFDSDSNWVRTGNEIVIEQAEEGLYSSYS